LQIIDLGIVLVAMSVTSAGIEKLSSSRNVSLSAADKEVPR